MDSYYVSGSFDGIDIGTVVLAKNQYMAAYKFIDETSTKFGTNIKSIFVLEVELRED